MEESGLSELVDALPNGFICVSDAAYQPTEKNIPVFGGDLALRKDNDNANYYISQLRVRIEMAFGMMSMK